MSMMIIFGDEAFGVLSDEKQHIIAVKTPRTGTDAPRRIAVLLSCELQLYGKDFLKHFTNACTSASTFM